MSEQLDPEVLAKLNEQQADIEEDPLAELARIVASEPESEIEPNLEPEVVAPVVEEPEQVETAPETQNMDLVSVAEEPAPIEPVSLEPEIYASPEELTPLHEEPADFSQILEDELIETPGHENTSLQDYATEEFIAPPEEAEVDHFTPSLEQAIAPSETAQAPQASVDHIATGVIHEESTPVPPVPEETSFQDELISAMQAEIQHPTPAIVDVAPEYTDPIYVEPDHHIEEERLVLPSEPVPELNLEAKLEEAFARGHETHSEQSVHEPAAYEEQLIQEDTYLQEAEQNVQSLDDLDFGSAFAEELGVETIAEVDGWHEGDTASANAAFADAARPNESTPELTAFHEPEIDPGHAGILPGAGMPVSNPGPIEGSGSKKYAIAALVIALFAGTIAAGYGFLGEGSTVNTDEPRLIKADAEPFKVKPEDPGGRVPANQDNASYESVAGENTNEFEQPSLISQTEEPAEIATTGAFNDAQSNLGAKSEDRLAARQEIPTAQSGVSSIVAPRQVNTVTVKPDGTIIQTSPTISTQGSGSEVQVASNTIPGVSNPAQSLANGIVATPKEVETVSVSKPASTGTNATITGNSESVSTTLQSIDGAVSTKQIAVPVASPLPKPVETAAASPQVQAPATQETVNVPVRKSEWVVQVSSQRTPEAAQASFQNLKGRFSALQGRSMAIQQAQVNGGTFYRVRIQTDSRADAIGLCESLKSSGGSCFVTR